MAQPAKCVVLIFGASGDLTKRKLMPALFSLFAQRLLPDDFAILGLSRTAFSDEVFRDRITKAIRGFSGTEPDQQKLTDFVARIYYQALDTQDPKAYEQLSRRISEIDRQHSTNGNYIFYLSTPPFMYETIARNLHGAGLHDSQNGWKRLVVEKPFGYDLESAQKLNRNLLECFEEEQIYRIDHYLGKETVQNLLVFRFSNEIFEPLWNSNYVSHVEVTSAEHIGIEDRGKYFDSAGILRDMVQNHLLQVVGMIAMEPPHAFNARAVRNETIKVFESIKPYSGDDIRNHVLRGQYTASTIRGEPVLGYRDEKDVAPGSRTETFVAMKFYIQNWRWGGVPFFIRSGKRMPTRVTEAVIHFKPKPHQLFEQSKSLRDANKLIIRIQPDEGILLKFGMKQPGAGFTVKKVNMDFRYADLADTYQPKAYERLLLDCMLGDATLYTRNDAVEACWRFVDPVLKAWSGDESLKVFGYPAGTWGPAESEQLLREHKVEWRYPCKNLADDGEYCEL